MDHVDFLKLFNLQLNPAQISFMKVAMVDGLPDISLLNADEIFLKNMPREVVTFVSGIDIATIDPNKWPELNVSEFVPDIQFIETQDPPCKPSKLRVLAGLHKDKMMGLDKKGGRYR